MLLLVQMGAIAADAVINGISHFLNNDRKKAKVTGVMRYLMGKLLFLKRWSIRNRPTRYMYW